MKVKEFFKEYWFGCGCLISVFIYAVSILIGVVSNVWPEIFGKEKQNKFPDTLITTCIYTHNGRPGTIHFDEHCENLKCEKSIIYLPLEKFACKYLYDADEFDYCNKCVDEGMYKRLMRCLNKREPYVDNDTTPA